VYDITYGVVKPSDNLVIIDDSIVRGTTLQKSILRMLDRLGPKKIVVVSSAPQIRYPDCYGIDMAKLEEFIAFRAALSLLQQDGVYEEVVQSVYDSCKQSVENKESTPPNHVKRIYERYSNDQISKKISVLLKNDSIKAEVEVIFQTVEGLHKACPKNLGDWYFTGDYPTPGGCRVVNQAFLNFVEKNNKRAY
jgi:amidophosphoribosyltransferase